MSALRKLLRVCYANAAIIFFISSISMVPFFLRMRADNRALSIHAAHAPTLVESLLIGLSELVVLSPLFLTVVNGMAWWTLKNGYRSARLWALVASLTFLLLSALLIFTDTYISRKSHNSQHPPMVIALIAVQLFIGLAGVIAFGPRDSLARIAAEGPPARVNGDGTHRFLDATALILQVGGTFWLVDVYSKWGYEQDLPFAHGLESWVQWLIVLIAVTLVHESGHALVGIALGMKLRAFVIGPFQFRVYGDRWRFEFHPTQLLALSGAAGLTPTDPDQSRWNEVAMIAAGPFANLVTGAVTAAMAYSALENPWWPFWEYFALFATVSLVAGIVNLIPLRPDSLYSDGARILQLFRGGPIADYQRAVKTIQCTIVSRRRPRDYDIAAIERASEHFTTGPQGVLLRQCATSYYFDQGRFEQASTVLADAERIYRESARDIPLSLHANLLIKGFLLGRDRAWLCEKWAVMQTAKSGKYDQDCWLAKCVYHWAEGDISAARQAWSTGHDYLAKLPDVGTYNYDRDSYAKVEQILSTAPIEATAAISATASPSLLQTHLSPAPASQ